MLTRKIQIGQITVWILIQQLQRYETMNKDDISIIDEYIVYFRFREPTAMIFGELVKDAAGKIKVFTNIEDATEGVIKFIKKKWAMKDKF